jgi:FkbM family methyltransferase
MASLIRASAPVIWIRGITRRLGINTLLMRLLDRGDYEAAFHSMLMRSIKPGDTIWDVGANVGHYTKEFAAATGPSGHVVAFEPVSKCFAELQSVCGDVAQVRLLNAALGSKDHKAMMTLSKDPLGVTHRLSNAGSQEQGAAEVFVRAARSIVQETPEIFPAIVKIDVEGHEEDVLQGFGELLSDQRLRTIGVEVHFGVLERKGDALAPRRIHKLLDSHGLRVTWTDRSHLVATRRA